MCADRSVGCQSVSDIRFPKKPTLPFKQEFVNNSGKKNIQQASLFGIREFIFKVKMNSLGNKERI